MADDTVVEVLLGDITTLQVDAIVNAANTTLLGGGGVDGAIHSAAGPDLKHFCGHLGGCPTGEAKLSPGFNLSARAVIHTVGPVWEGGGNNEADLLESCYRSVLKIAADEAFETLAFPAISCGVYGYPLEQAVTIAVNAVRQQLPTMPRIKKIIFCCFGQDLFDLYAARLL